MGAPSNVSNASGAKCCKSEVSYVVMKFVALIKNQFEVLSRNLGMIMVKIILIIH